MPLSKTSPESDLAVCLNLSDFDLRLERYRIVQPKADQLLARSISKYGQLAPVVYCQLEDALVLVDGFKRLRAARTLKGVMTLHAQKLEVDEHGAKAAIFNLNRIASRPNELEESWIIYALVHDDGLEQVEVAWSAYAYTGTTLNTVAARQPKRSPAVRGRACVDFT